jgi:FPC/CPF motif-containing protein YcgG
VSAPPPIGRTDLDLLTCAWLAPFDDDDARAHSDYCAYHRGSLVHLLESAPVSNFTRVAHDSFRSFVLDDAYPCLGARAALHRGSYRFAAYDRIDDPAVSKGLMRDLYAFTTERGGIGTGFTTFVAVFREPVAGGELGFERALWSQLDRLHALDRRYHAWDAAVSDDPADPNFSFSLAGNAFFVVGLHPGATRDARRFAWPALVFNAHTQFDELKAAGRFEGLQTQIRARDLQLQGSLNANLAEYGHHSEARQYAGRAVEEEWTCPFRRSN